MFIEEQVVRGVSYLRLVKRVPKINASGKRTTTKKTIKSLGRLSDLEDGKPDYVKRLRQSFNDGCPLLSELEPYVDVQTSDELTAVCFHNGEKECRLDEREFAPALLDPLFRELGLNALLTQVKHASKAQYDLLGLTRLLVYGRLLHPCSKRATADQNSLYYEPPVQGNFNKDNLYDVLDDIYAARNRIFRTLNKNITCKAGRDTSVLLYDVTNIFWHSDEPDPDVTDEDGTILRAGARKRGKSKENRKEPIRQIALFTDRAGLPLYMEDFAGNILMCLRCAQR